MTLSSYSHPEPQGRIPFGDPVPFNDPAGISFLPPPHGFSRLLLEISGSLSTHESIA